MSTERLEIWRVEGILVAVGGRVGGCVVGVASWSALVRVEG